MLPLSTVDKRAGQYRRRKSSVSALQRRVWRTYSRKTIALASTVLLILPLCVFAFFASNGRGHFSPTRKGPVIQTLRQNTLHDTHQFQPKMNTSSDTEKLPLGLVMLPNLELLRVFSPTACRLQQTFQKILIMITSIQEPIRLSDYCLLDATPGAQAEDSWQLASLKAVNRSKPEVLFTCHEIGQIPMPISAFQRLSPYTTVILMPCQDLQYTEWLGTLEAQELINWHTPRIELSVITNDRPRSLVRLLRSLNNSVYFGDLPTLHINLEQTADYTTRELVQGFNWQFGQMHIRHRIIHGGLLPAVVESWFPQNNHTYGVILEDDVEVSPLFYAWLKMALLRYRYGNPANASPALFGISLYQQRSLELIPSGRRPFNVPSLLSESGIEDVHTPYLSQIPCSWGAVFFPEHWKEFHDYLVVRMSELTHDISEIIVPEVRSNSWRRSWKKYFIELVYLRGYVMLYPNYPGNLSLSTNHLEIGSHVRQLPEHILTQRKELFTPPLMPLSSSSMSLLQLPQGRLPEWTQLPITDLMGLVTTEIDIIRNGMERRVEVSGCSLNPAQGQTYDARELLCGDYYERDGPVY